MRVKELLDQIGPNDTLIIEKYFDGTVLVSAVDLSHPNKHHPAPTVALQNSGYKVVGFDEQDTNPSLSASVEITSRLWKWHKEGKEE